MLKAVVGGLLPEVDAGTVGTKMLDDDDARVEETGLLVDCALDEAEVPVEITDDAEDSAELDNFEVVDDATINDELEDRGANS